MIPYRLTLVLITCVTCLSYTPNVQSQGLSSPTPSASQSSIKPDVGNTSTPLPEASPSATVPPNPQQSAPDGKIEILQTKLKQLGYYDGLIDGLYGSGTKAAISKFQAAVGLTADGIANDATWERLQAEPAEKPSPTVTSKPFLAADKSNTDQTTSLPHWFWLALGVLLTLVGLGGGIYVFLKAFGYEEFDEDETELPPSQLSETYQTRTERVEFKPQKKLEESRNNSYTPAPVKLSKINSLEVQPKNQTSAEALPVEQTTRLEKINIVDELIQDLHARDKNKRRKAIWDLAQQGDSRALQPLLELMIDSDSQQRSLILEAVSQIGTRTLKPMNRALALSLQDQNANVRKNAIRDITRIYELLAQMNQLLLHAVDDSDAEVQQTAEWALKQLNHIRAASGIDNFPSLPNYTNSSENSSSEPPL